MPQPEMGCVILFQSLKRAAGRHDEQMNRGVRHMNRAGDVMPQPDRNGRYG